MPSRASIRALLLRLVLAVALPLAALAAWNLYAAAQADSARARHQVLQLATITASEAARFLGQAQKILNGMAVRPAIGALDPARCDPILKDFLALAPRFSNVVTITLDGSVVCSAVPLARPQKVNADVLLDRLRGPDHLTVGKITPGGITGKWAVPVGRPLLDAQGRVAGAVGLSIDLLSYPLLPSIEGLPAGVVVGLLAADGTVLARSVDAARYVGTTAGAGRPAQQEKSGTAEAMGVDGILRIQGFAPVAGTDWIAIASVPASEVYAGVKVRTAASALIGIGVLVATLLLALRWSHSIGDPIAALSRATDEVAAGNPSARAPVAGAAEVADVAMQFNAMLDARVRANAELRESESRFRSLTELSSDFYWEQDEQFRFVKRVGNVDRWSIPEGKDFLGKPRWELPAMNLTGEDWKRHRADLEAHREFRDLEIERRLPSGEAHWISSSGRPFFDAEGRFRGYHGIGRDITARKLAEQALRASEQSYATLLGNLTGFAYRCRNDKDWTIDFVSEGCFEVTGYRSGELLANRVTSFGALIHPDDAQALWEKCAAGLAAREACSNEYRLVHRDGTVRWVWDQAQGVYSASGELQCIEGFVSDITARKLTDEALRESREGLHQAGQIAGLAHVITRPDGSFESWSENLPALIGMDADRMPKSTRATLALVHPEERAAFRDLSIQAAKSRTQFDMEYRLQRGDGSWINVRHIGEPVPGAGDARGNVRWFCTVQDVTQRARAEAELRTSQLRLTALTRRLLEVQETGRRSLARELHDEVGGVLTAVKLNLQSLRGKRSGEAALADAMALVDGAIQAVRSLSLDLRPAMLDDLGLVPALKWYCERQSQRAGIPIDVALNAIDLQRAPQLESACFRIVQEAVTNVLRHARARRIRVGLHRDEGGFELEIADEGCGFDVAAAERQAHAGERSGLLGMEERARLLGGTLRIDSTPGRGTRVRAHFAVPDGGFA